MGRKVTMLAAAASAAALMFGMAPAKAAAPIILGTEDPVNGFVGNLLALNFPTTSYLVASDGESAFDPFGAGFDTSDGINFSGVPFVWNQWHAGTWTNIGFQTWVLPASIPGCGSENNTTCEPAGHFWSPTPWNPLAIGTYLILEPPGDTGTLHGTSNMSDEIITWNDAHGTAHLDFYSDPNGSPEPSTWAMMLLGFAGLGFAGYRARKATAALAV